MLCPVMYVVKKKTILVRTETLNIKKLLYHSSTQKTHGNGHVQVAHRSGNDYAALCLCLDWVLLLPWQFVSRR